MVFPSVVHNYVIGNVRDVESWNDLWYTKRADEVRHSVLTKGQPAWMICTARTAIKRHPLKVGWWVIRNKFGGVRL